MFDGDGGLVVFLRYFSLDIVRRGVENVLGTESVIFGGISGALKGG